MNKLQNILVPIDFSNTSRLILAQGARLASWSGATLHVFHVIEQGSLKHFEATHGKQDRPKMEDRARELMQKCLDEAKIGNVSAQQSVVVGDPANAIVERIGEIQADLAVLSAHDTSHKRLGRVAAHVVRRAPCKVLIARDWQPGPFHKIAVCIDFSDFSREVLRQAIEVALQDDASLEMIHVLYPIDRDYSVYKIDFGIKTEAEYRAGVEAHMQGRIEQFTARFRAELDRLKFTVSTLESTAPSVAITSHLRSNDFDLAVLGTTGKENWFGLRFGSNAERLVHDTHCSVLAIKSPPPASGA